ncbi:BtrH N-terminal domain-containing protein [Weeksella virosa]|uniref:Peptidase n=1 Tax=Weeksella virosa (strain ATCC 43766 / DSM 16922 / JCM 21250 / CCUG 30538 / CDC 9751 / IAM 14551 / NBRC 16016 / NCTC 11634 / CL345/78) TaxID=865938 RepID=F0NZ41_WEEVC|nr:BtrH N-terminal domain-containing protein [Weeksella virosa]ADX68258.1 hypothetical protein Weevi_1558 [Weeksella virosa DSM 16922]MDK7374640.1 BtrH N-terminal domain-containing protein [Weeksella virosa]VEH64105.1 Uncharacterised protein [Weeksella virosa]
MEKNKEIPFVHHQSAHCETGVASNLLKNRGLDISEAMVFGIGSGLFFVYLPFLKVNHAPAISYRPMPGRIFTCLAKRLGLKIERKKFRSEEEAQKLLDQKIAENIPCGLQVGVYNLPYFPDEYRFHFNAHNLVIYGKKEDHYLVSDPVLNHPTELSAKDLEKVRFAKGVLAPKGHMYYLTEIATHIDWDKAIRKAIQKTCNEMLAPVPIAGVRGMRWLAKDIRKWPKKIGNVKTNYYLAQIVRMQEEIGTGGGGFRYLFAVFLQESSEKIQQPILDDFSKEMIAIGNQWRDFALQASRVYKKRSQLEEVYNTLADELLVLANKEEDFFKRLKKALK